MSEKNKLSAGSIRALELIKENPDGLTIAEIKKLGFEDANSSQLTALKKRGLIDSIEVEIEVPAIIKRKVQKYFIKTEKEGE